MTITHYKDKQDYLKDLSQRHPDIVKLEQVKVLGNKHQIVLTIKFIIQIIKQSKILLILTKLGLSHEGRAIWLVKIGKKGAPETTPRCQSASRITSQMCFIPFCLPTACWWTEVCMPESGSLLPPQSALLDIW